MNTNYIKGLVENSVTFVIRNIIFGHEPKPLENLQTAIARANAGDSEMCYSLAMYFLGHEEKAENGSWNVIKRDIDEAVKWAEKCAALGNSNGFAFLGDLCNTEEAALSKYKDSSKAIEFYRKGSDMEHLYCSYKLADLLSDDRLLCNDKLISKRDFYEISKERNREALTLYRKIYDIIVNDYYRKSIAAKMASCYTALADLEEALEWYKRADVSEFKEEIRALNTILKLRLRIKDCEAKYQQKPSLARARSIADAYWRLSSEGRYWLEEDEFLDVSRKAIQWMNTRRKYLDEEIKFVDKRVSVLEDEISFRKAIKE